MPNSIQLGSRRSVNPGGWALEGLGSGHHAVLRAAPQGRRTGRENFECRLQSTALTLPDFDLALDKGSDVSELCFGNCYNVNIQGLACLMGISISKLYL